MSRLRPECGTATKGSAIADDTALYLIRDSVADAPVMVWVMLNPSTADGESDDPTIRKCMGFARRSSHGGIIVVNLFAYRATDPKTLRSIADPVGPDNDDHILWACQATHGPQDSTRIAGWGANPEAKLKGAHWYRARSVARRSGHGNRCSASDIQQQDSRAIPLMLAYNTPLVKLRSPR